MSQQDWMLMHRVAAGDEAAVAELYDRFETLVFKVSRQLLPTKAEAEDAVQEIFIRLWKTADRYDPRRAKLVTWVMLIARRHLIDRLRRSAVRPTESSIDAGATNPSETIHPDRAIAIVRSPRFSGTVSWHELSERKVVADYPRPFLPLEKVLDADRRPCYETRESARPR